MSNSGLLSIVLSIVLTTVACSENNVDSATESFDYDALHGEWVITEVHWLDVNDTSSRSTLQVATDLKIANLYFYRPTLGDSARLEMGWYCDGLGFSFEYANGKLVRTTDIAGFNGPWSTPSNLTSSKNLRASCVAIPPNQQQQFSEVGDGMHKLANRLTLFETYQLEIIEENVVSLFTEQGDGVYATRQ